MANMESLARLRHRYMGIGYEGESAAQDPAPQLEPSMDVLTRPQPPVDHRLPYAGARSQFGELRLPKGKGPFPVVVGIHGGWWRAEYGLESHSHLCAALTAAGFATWNIEYRRVGEAGGAWPGTADDVSLAIDFVASLAETYRLDLTRVLTVGFSAGGHLALWAAARHRLPEDHPLRREAKVNIRGAVSLAGAADLKRCAELELSDRIVEKFLEGTPEKVPGRYAEASPIELLPFDVPQILIHGTTDTSVPVEISERHHATAVARGDRCELLLLPGMGHFELIDPLSAAWPVVHEAVIRLAALPGPLER